ncbi:hypothetical protein KAT24_01470 [Candidatus Pacearchaeota archaeon]|nr:hypothetical protein [Candidatus Pacearchaeota archaeon]
MKNVVLDTSFILTCIRNKIDFLEEIKLKGFQIVVPKQVIKELERLVKTKKGKIKNQSKLALKLLKINKPKLIDLKTNYVDKGIVKYSKKHDIIVATLDSELKKKIKNSKLVIREKKRLEVI